MNPFSRVVTLLVLAISSLAAAAETERPLMRDFIGLNVHTVQFKPELYAPVCRHVRDYHPIVWDLGDDTSHATTFPLAANKVDWGTMYGAWNKAGYDIDACCMFDNILPDHWKNFASDARAYGESFARFFGPTHGKGLVSSIEIGNEPAKYSEADYRTIFQNMARGIREVDPKLKIVTCAVMTGKTDQWSKPLTSVAGLEELYDVLNVHTYAFKDKWPTWRRSFPEDPSIPYLKSVLDVIQWRDANAPGKEIWITEFGYDSAAKRPDPNGPWKQWEDVSDTRQAQYIVRSFLLLSSMDVGRAYLYFFNDEDEPQLHGASGITRNFKPKPSFYAMAHLQSVLGNYRFARLIVVRDGNVYCFEYSDAARPAEKVYVAWSPTGSDRSVQTTLPIKASEGTVYRAERMPLSQEAPEMAKWRPTADGVSIELTETPVYLWAARRD